MNAYPLQPGFSPDSFSALMLALHKLDFSDISIVTGKPIWGKRHGSLVGTTARVMTDSELRTIIAWLYGPNAVTEISKGKPIDKRYEVQMLHHVIDEANQIIDMFGFPNVLIEKPKNQTKKIPFRMNAVGAYTPKGRGISISLRTIPLEVPKLEDMQLPAGLFENVNQAKGLTMIVGETGSGKSTLLAAIMRDKLINSKNRKIITIESPIEFDLQHVRSDSCFVVQHEVTADLPSFYDGIVNALRQAPTDILVGEARDEESISGMIAAAETGHATYATVHASSVSGTLMRIANEFSTDSRDQVVFKVISQVRLIVVQRLMMSRAGGKRVPVREWLLFEDDFKKSLMKLTANEALVKIDEKVMQSGQSMRQQVLNAYQAGHVELAEVRSIVGNFTKEERDVIELVGVEE